MPKIYPHSWVFLCSRDPKCTNQTLDILLTTGCVFAVFLFLLATSDYWQLEQSGFCQVPSLELKKQRKKKQSLRSPGQSCAPHWEEPNTYRWTWAHLCDHCLFDFFFSHSSAHGASFHKGRPESKLENGENVQSSISTSPWQLDIPRFSEGPNESEKPECNLFYFLFF